MNILFIGDVVGQIGRSIVLNKLPLLKSKYQIDFTIANLENATHGKGLSYKHYELLTRSGIDCVTMGNHFYRNKDVFTYALKMDKLVRPYNLYKDAPNVGTRLFDCKGKKIRVTNLLGRAFMDLADKNPFDCLEDIISEEKKSDIHIVDFHAEATGEKMCLAKCFDGEVSAVIGTHTHVQTSDDRILYKGTGFISDAGMCGYYDGILGVCEEGVIRRTRTGLPSLFETPDEGRAMFNGIVLKFDDVSNKLIETKKIYIVE